MTETLGILREPDPGKDHGLKAGLLAAFRRLLRPLVRILIRHGVAYGEFAEVAKTVFVETAAEDFALPGRKSSGSRIAILTGLTRKEVKRISDLRQAKERGESLRGSGNLHRATRVLSGWYQDPQFAGPYGVPTELDFDGDGTTFSKLVRRYSGDMPARAMLEELKRVRAVEELENGRIRAISRYYIAEPLDPRGARNLGDVIHDIASTIEHNMNPDRTSPARFERWVTTENAAPEILPDFKDLVRDHGQEFLERLDNWLSVHEPTAASEKNGKRIRVGVYFFEDDTHGDSESCSGKARSSGPPRF